MYGGLRVCAGCYAVLRAESTKEGCSGCGQVRVVRQRDRDGRPRCQACPVDIDHDPVDALLARIQAIEPRLSSSAIVDAVTAAADTRYEQQRLLWALEDNPYLLTSDVARGSRRMVLLVGELETRGATTITVPPCPLCGKPAPLNRVLDGVRCCRTCWERTTRIKTCVDCGRQ